jgi:hypothetical protein
MITDDELRTGLRTRPFTAEEIGDMVSANADGRRPRPTELTRLLTFAYRAAQYLEAQELAEARGAVRAPGLARSSDGLA